MIRAISADVVELIYDGAGAAEGETLGVPTRTRASTLVISIASDLDPGAFSFYIEVALKRITDTGEVPTDFALLDIISNGIATETPVGDSYPDFGWDFVKITQVTKANDVVTTIGIKLA